MIWVPNDVLIDFHLITRRGLLLLMLPSAVLRLPCLDTFHVTALIHLGLHVGEGRRGSGVGRRSCDGMVKYVKRSRRREACREVRSARVRQFVVA